MGVYGPPGQSEDGVILGYSIILEWLSEHVRSCIFKTYQEALKDISAILFRWYVLKQYQKVLKILNQYQKSTRRGIMRIYKIPRNKSSLRIIGELGDGKSDYRVNLF